MGAYTPTSLSLPDGLDEIGLRLGLTRFENESLDTYRRRLLLETSQPSGATFRELARAMSRKVGVFDIPVFEIDVVQDADGVPTATDPRVEVTAARLLAWEDYAGGVLDFEVNLVDRGTGYWLRDVKTAFDGSTYFTLSVLDTGYTYYRSDRLQVGTTYHVSGGVQLEGREVHDFEQKYLQTVHFTNAGVFRELVGSRAAIVSSGQYYIDTTNGVVWSYEPMRGVARYEYNDFPYTLWYQNVRTFELKDPDIDYILKDTLVDEDGNVTPQTLGSVGARMLDELFEAHPLEWGE